MKTLRLTSIATILFFLITQSLGAKPQNILFIFMEDMGLQFSVYGDNSAPTPALERLASQGVVYNHAYCTQATCSPSRSSVYSGQYPHQTGHMGLAGNYGYAMQPGFTTFLSLLKQKHYFTGYSYKIHVAPNQAIAKDYDRAYNISRFVKDKTDPKDFHQSAKYFRDFLQEKPNDQPFFYMAQTHDTHEPFNRGAFKTAPNAHPYKTLLGKDVKPLKSFGRGQTFEGYFADQVASYYNAIQRVDAFVAQIMKTLEDSGHLDDTVVVFSSDHGPSFARGKLSTHELGIRVPLIVRWPKTQVPGSHHDALVSLVDLPATFLDIASISKPNSYVGQSLRSLSITGNPPKHWRDHLCCEFTSHTTVDYWPMRSIRNERYKLIHSLLADSHWATRLKSRGRVQREGYAVDMEAGLAAPAKSSSRLIYERVLNPNEFELYDLKSDPYENIDLSTQPEFSSLKQSLLRELMSWREATKDPFLSEEYTQRFTEAQLKKQADIAEWEKVHGHNKFWGKTISKGNWQNLLTQP